MVCVKKVFSVDFVNLALILSLVRLNSIDLIFSVSRSSVDREINLGTSAGLAQTNFFDEYSAYRRENHISYKSVYSDVPDTSIFNELNSLGYYSRHTSYNRDIFAYLLNDETNTVVHAEAEVPQGSLQPSDVTNQTDDYVYQSEIPSQSSVTIDLSPEDADLIEILWKQDIDLGITRDVYDAQARVEAAKKVAEEEYQKSKLVTEKLVEDEQLSDMDLWHGHNYTIDTETGESIIIPNKDEIKAGIQPLPSSSTDGNEDDAQREIIELLDDFTKDNAEPAEPIQVNGLEDALEETNLCDADLNFQLDDLIMTQDSMQQYMLDDGFALEDLTTHLPSVQNHHTLEERWQDVANLLNIPSNVSTAAYLENTNNTLHDPLHVTSSVTPLVSNYHPVISSSNIYQNALIENATLPIAIEPLSPVAHPPVLEQSSFVNVVTNSLATLTNGSGPGVDANPVNFNFENNYFLFGLNQSAPTNQTANFLSELLGDEGLELMDMAIDNGGARVNHTEDKVDVSSDSAISSAHSERLPSFSDAEWLDSESNSSQQEYQDSTFASETTLPSNAYGHLQSQNGIESNRFPNASNQHRAHVAQKKYNFFGKHHEMHNLSDVASSNNGSEISSYNQYDDRASNYSRDFNTSYPVEGAMAMHPCEDKILLQHQLSHVNRENMVPAQYVHHNHSYNLPPEDNGFCNKPKSRDKLSRKQIDSDKSLSRDERRIKELNIPLSIDEIISLPMDEFNERLSKHNFSETQLTLIRDIRRRGKNKVAAQNCRKRKLNQIYSLEDELNHLSNESARLASERDQLALKKESTKLRYMQLHNQVFQTLLQRQQRIAVGQPYSNPEDYSLQLTPDGNVYLVPKNSSSDYYNRRRRFGSDKK